MGGKVSMITTQLKATAPALGNDGIAALPLDDWYLAQLKTNCLERARVNLGRQAFQTFMPMRQATFLLRGRPKSQSRALFPGYIFVRVPTEAQNWRKVNSTYGVSKIVALRAGFPTRVAPNILSALLCYCEGQDWIPPIDILEAGTTVRILSGPFASSIARLAAASDSERVQLLMEMMGHDVRLTTSRAYIEPV